MVDEIILEPRDAIYNAGLYGLYELLIEACEDDEALKEKIKSRSDGLLVPTKLLNGLEKKWVDLAIERFGKDCALTRLLTDYEKLKSSRNEPDKNDIKKFRKDLKERLDKASKSAYTIIADNGDGFDAPGRLKEIKDLPDREFIEGVMLIMEYLEQHKRTFLMFEIGDLVIKYYWKGRAFIRPKPDSAIPIKNTDPELCIKIAFITPILDWLSYQKRQTKTCLMCGSAMLDGFSKSMSWICDVGVDNAKKQSNFYNFVPDACICPLCALVYSCLPFGFTIESGSGLFINDNSSFEAIKVANAHFRSTADDTEKGSLQRSSSSFGGLWHLRRRAYEALCNLETAKRHEAAVQIIQRRVVKKDKTTFENYYVEQLSFEKLFVLKNCAKQFERLTNINVNMSKRKDKPDYINLFTEATDNLMSARSQHQLMGRLMRRYLDAETPIRGIDELLRIEIYIEQARKMIVQKEDTMDFSYDVYKKASAYSAKAAAMHDRLSKAEGGSPSEKEKKMSNKLRGYIYKLLNQLNTRDYQGFADSVARMHLSVGEDFPTDMLMEMMISEDKFQTYGMAYIYGLSNGTVNNNNVNNQEEA